jgi:hypothetical protein
VNLILINFFSLRIDAQYADAKYSKERYDRFIGDPNFCTSSSNCFSMKIELTPISNLITNAPVEKNFISLFIIFGGYYSVFRSLYRSAMIVYVGFTFYLTSISQILFPKKKNESEIELKTIEVKEESKEISNHELQ